MMKAPLLQRLRRRLQHIVSLEMSLDTERAKLIQNLVVFFLFGGDSLMLQQKTSGMADPHERGRAGTHCLSRFFIAHYLHRRPSRYKSIAACRQDVVDMAAVILHLFCPFPLRPLLGIIQFSGAYYYSIPLSSLRKLGKAIIGLFLSE